VLRNFRRSRLRCRPRAMHARARAWEGQPRAGSAYAAAQHLEPLVLGDNIRKAQLEHLGEAFKGGAVGKGALAGASRHDDLSRSKGHRQRRTKLVKAGSGRRAAERFVAGRPCAPRQGNAASPPGERDSAWSVRGPLLESMTDAPASAIVSKRLGQFCLTNSSPCAPDVGFTLEDVQQAVRFRSCACCLQGLVCIRLWVSKESSWTHLGRQLHVHLDPRPPDLALTTHVDPAAERLGRVCSEVAGPSRAELCR